MNFDIEMLLLLDSQISIASIKYIINLTYMD